MKSPVDVLKEEHLLLKQAITTTTQLQEINDNELYHSKLQDMILFFRNFTELYHDPKETNILYPILQAKNSNNTTSELQDICHHSEDLELMIADIIDDYVAYDMRNLRKSVARYLEELSMQIEQEENILDNAWNLLSEAESDMIYKEFVQHDEKDRLMGAIKKNFYKISNQISINN